MAFHLNNKESCNKWEVALRRRTRVFERRYLWLLRTKIVFVSFNFTDESDVAKRFALQTSHCALQWYETLDGYGKMDGASLSVYKRPTPIEAASVLLYPYRVVNTPSKLF